MVMMVVITAPGADVLPWDRRRCVHLPDVKCSGKIGCRVDARARARWEAESQRKWTNLRQAIVMRLKRQGYRSPLLALVDEDQSRGAWHRNLILDASDPRPAWEVVRLLDELAPRYGFGYTDRRPQLMPGIQAANYGAGYLTNRGGRKGDATMQAIARRVNSRRRVWWVSPRLTRDTRVTMGTIANGRRMWAADEGLIARPTEGQAVKDWQVIDMSTGAIIRKVWDLEDIAQSASRLAGAGTQSQI